jgi:hypothetical protein
MPHKQRRWTHTHTRTHARTHRNAAAISKRPASEATRHDGVCGFALPTGRLNGTLHARVHSCARRQIYISYRPTHKRDRSMTIKKDGDTTRQTTYASPIQQRPATHCARAGPTTTRGAPHSLTNTPLSPTRARSVPPTIAKFLLQSLDFAPTCL